jgi:hypothetical protein
MKALMQPVLTALASQTYGSQACDDLRRALDEGGVADVTSAVALGLEVLDATEAMVSQVVRKWDELRALPTSFPSFVKNAFALLRVHLLVPRCATQPLALLMYVRRSRACVITALGPC